MSDDLFITDSLSVPAWELQESFVQASGPGGQNVNKVATAVQLRWNVETSSLPAPVKARFKRRYASRITLDGDVIIDARSHRSQALNRKAARARLVEMVKATASPPKRRIPTKPTGGSVRRRLAAKKRRADVKALRGKIEPGD
ncbi:MAG: alternative ribosome rescue aminoacyl-tRNA hydrolase ArfB [Pseudomonadota bacterium]